MEKQSDPTKKTSTTLAVSVLSAIVCTGAPVPRFQMTRDVRAVVVVVDVDVLVLCGDLYLVPRPFRRSAQRVQRPTPVRHRPFHVSVK